MTRLVKPEAELRLRQFSARALSTFETVRTTYLLARDVIERGVPGDLVDCGTFCGSQAAAMALALADSGDRARRVHLFDSFQGIPLSGPHDNDIRPLIPKDNRTYQASPISSGVSASSMESVRGHMIEWGIDPDSLVWHAGWFQDTVPQWPMSDPISVLRLDGDLYESTAVCMRWLRPRVSTGGWIVADDFALDGCRKAVLEAMGGGAHMPPIYWQQTR